jgi:hypothetical protein
MATNLFTNGNESKILTIRMATNLLTNGNEYKILETQMATNLKTNDNKSFVAIRLSFVVICVIN